MHTFSAKSELSDTTGAFVLGLRRGNAAGTEIRSVKGNPEKPEKTQNRGNEAKKSLKTKEDACYRVHCIA
jgi:hypothetical protein